MIWKDFNWPSLQKRTSRYDFIKSIPLKIIIYHFEFFRVKLKVDDYQSKWTVIKVNVPEIRCLLMKPSVQTSDRPDRLKWPSNIVHFGTKTVHFRPDSFWGAYLFHFVHKWSFHTILCEVRPTVPLVIEFALFQYVYYYSPNLTRQLFRPSISDMFHPFRDRILNLFVNKSQNYWLVSI